MKLSQALTKEYTSEQYSAKEARQMAEFIAWGPVVFQVSRLMVKFGILDMIRDSEDGLTCKEIVAGSGLSEYAVKCLIEASLSIGLILFNPDTYKFTIGNTGWFIINDPAIRVNIDFNHHVNYRGWFHLEESLLNGRPEGLKCFGEWPTIYEGLSGLPEQVQKAWFGFDHFYSDSSFPQALEIVFRKNRTRTLYDVGGNTGKWAAKCVEFDKDVNVTVLDLPQQIEMMKKNVSGKTGAGRICGYGINLLDRKASFPVQDGGVDAIWMSQFLDCFSKEEIVSILERAKEVMSANTRIYIMETLWDRQKYGTAAFCLTMTSLYFTTMANGNSKMYCTDDMEECVCKAGLMIEEIYDNLGLGHSILKVKLK